MEKAPAKGGEFLLVSGALPDAGPDDLIGIYDREKAREPRTAAVLLGTAGEKVSVLVAVTPVLAKAGADARQVFAAGSAAIAGRGGGRPEMVRGSGTRAAGVPEALAAMTAKVREMLASPGKRTD